MRCLNIILVCIIFYSCNKTAEDFVSTVLTSSKGEAIYINSVNWGLTGDKQLSIVTKNKNRLKNDDFDTSGAVGGLNPFLYSFVNDTLTLYFSERINYHVFERFETIHLNYLLLDNPEYMKLSKSSESNIFPVPKRKSIEYPADMPKPHDIQKQEK